MIIPGVDPIISLTFRATVDDPARFGSSRSVGALVGLTPRVYQFGETERLGHISKTGDRNGAPSSLRGGLGTHDAHAQALKAEGLGVAVAQRRGAKRACVAVARKLAVIMHRMESPERGFRSRRRRRCRQSHRRPDTDTVTTALSNPVLDDGDGQSVSIPAASAAVAR